MNLKSAAVAAAGALLLGHTVALAATSTPNDPFFAAGQQWSLTGAAAAINAPTAWCASTGAGILVADVDTGADFNHPDLAGKLAAGAAFTSGNGTAKTGQRAVQDDHGHGTMTTGLMVARTDNGEGIASVAPDARALVIKVLDASGSGSSNDVAAGIRYAADNGATVINLSLGADLQGVAIANADTAIPQAINYAYGKGALVVVAAGNNGIPVTDYTVFNISSQALVVGALDRGGAMASYSSGGGQVNIYAPGGDKPNDADHLIVSTGWSKGSSTYLMGAGTSFAAPLVAGTAALLMAKGMTAAQAHDRIVATAASRGGLPELDAAAALGAVARCGTPSSRPPAKPPAVGNAGPPAAAASNQPGGASAPVATPPAAGPRPSAPASPSPVALAGDSPSPSPEAAATPLRIVPRAPAAPPPWPQVAIAVLVMAAAAAGVAWGWRARR